MGCDALHSQSVTTAFQQTCGRSRGGDGAMKDSVVLLEDNAREVLSYWGLRGGDWEVAGIITSGLEGISRPILVIGGQRYVLRRQADDLSENDTLFRQAFMRHLKGRGLPTPGLLPRPDGHTYAVVEDGIYELQEWLDGSRYVTGSPDEAEWMEAGATTLGLLHQASADFEWHQHTRSEERSGAGIAQAYVELIRERAEDAALPQAVRDGLARAAE